MVHASSLIQARLGQLLLLVGAMAIAGFTRTAMSPLQETMRLALSLTDNQMALVQGPIIGIPVALAAIPLGQLIDRYIRVRILQGLVALSLAGGFMTAVASGFGELLLARALAGVASLAILPVVLSVLADHFPPKQRGLVTTTAIIGQVAGNSAAFAWGGMLLTMHAGDWRMAMTSLTAACIPFALVTLVAREPMRTGVVIDNPSPRVAWRELRELQSLILPIVIAVVMAEVAVGAMIIWAAPMLARSHGLQPDQVGEIMAVGMLLSGILGPLLGGLLADFSQHTGGPRRTAAAIAVLALLSAPACTFAFIANTTGASALLVGSMTLMLAIAVMGMTLVSVVVPNEVRGLCISVLVALEILFALAVGPPAISLLSAAMGGLPMIGKALSIVCMSAGVCAATAMLLGRRALRRSTAFTT